MEINHNESDIHPLEGNEGGIYYLWYEGELVYIGKGWNCLLRVAEHTRKNSDKVFTHWSFERIDDNTVRSEREKELILKHKPKYNKRGID